MNLNAKSFGSPGVVVNLLIWGYYVGECHIKLKGLMGSNGQGWKSMFQQSRAIVRLQFAVGSCAMIFVDRNSKNKSCSYTNMF